MSKWPTLTRCTCSVCLFSVFCFSRLDIVRQRKPARFLSLNFKIITVYAPSIAMHLLFITAKSFIWQNSSWIVWPTLDTDIFGVSMCVNRMNNDTVLNRHCVVILANALHLRIELSYGIGSPKDESSGALNLTFQPKIELLRWILCNSRCIKWDNQLFHRIPSLLEMCTALYIFFPSSIQQRHASTHAFGKHRFYWTNIPLYDVWKTFPKLPCALFLSFLSIPLALIFAFRHTCVFSHYAQVNALHFPTHQLRYTGIDSW